MRWGLCGPVGQRGAALLVPSSWVSFLLPFPRCSPGLILDSSCGGLPGAVPALSLPYPLLPRAEPFPPLRSLCCFPSPLAALFLAALAPIPALSKRKEKLGEGGDKSHEDASRGSIPAGGRAFGATTRPRRAAGVPACPGGWLHGLWGEPGTCGTQGHRGGAGCRAGGLGSRAHPGTWEVTCARCHRGGDSRAALTAAISGPLCAFSPAVTGVSGRPGASSRQLLPFYF